MPNPWLVLAAVDLVLVRAPITEHGRYYHRHRVIMLRTGLSLVERRAALWHELVHAHRGDAGCGGGWFTRKEEASVDREAARWAMPLPALVEAWRGDPHVSEVADMLKTTEHLLGVRMMSLHPAERGVLSRAAQMREWVA